jgi:acyl-CoA reductase-like NAD-dependent aldehyde dehydrogenase
VFANVAAGEAHARSLELIERYFEAWNARDALERRRLLEAIADRQVEFRDAYAAIRGLEDLDQHVAAIHMHMPGARLERAAEPRQVQGAVLVDWIARRGSDTSARGTNFFEFTASGRIGRVYGFWNQ